MKKALILFILLISAFSLWAGGVYATGPTVTIDTASKTTQAGLYFTDDSLIIDKEKEGWINPIFQPL